MSQVSNTLLRIGDQFHRGFESRGDAAIQEAEFGLKKAGLERQARLDESGAPAREFGKTVAQRGLRQAAEWEAPAKGSMLMNSLGTLELMTSADQNGTPRIHKAVQYMFGEGATYDPGKDAILKKDGSVVTNAEMSRMSPKLQEWMTMNASPYRMARSARDEMTLNLTSLGKDHPNAPAVQQKIKEYGALMKNPEWKLSALEKRKAFVQGLPDDPFGEKKENLAQIDKEIGIVKGEYNAMVKRSQQLTDIETKNKQALNIENLKITSADKRAGLDRASRERAATIRAGASDKLKPSEMLAQEKRNIQNFSGKYQITKDPLDGFLTSPEYTEAQVRAIENDAKAMGIGVNFEPVVTKGKTNWFSPDEPDTTTYKINSVWGLGGQSSPGNGGALGQPQAQPGQGGQVSPENQPAAEPRQGTDGNFYVPDPNRPGKYLRVDPDEGTQTGDVVASHTPRTRGTSVYETATPAPAQTAQPAVQQAGTNVGPFQITAVNELSNVAEAIGLGKENWKQAAKVLADAGGFAVEELVLKPASEIKRLASALIASQAEARQNAGNQKPYGMR